MLAIGVDLGGTKIEACVVEVATGEVIARRRRPTAAADGAVAVVTRCAALLVELRRAEPAAAAAPVGVAVCEVVDPAGRITSAATVDLRTLDWREHLDGFVIVESDVRAAATAEVRYGAAADASAAGSTVVYLTIGTGIAHTLLIAGRPHLGAHGAAIVVGAPPVEQVSSGLAIARRCGVARAEEAFDDDRHSAVIADAADHLGRSMAALFDALDPHLVVIGGGLGLRDDYCDAAVSTMRETADVAKEVVVVKAELGESAAAIGAAYLASRPTRHARRSSVAVS